jgi:hypothetical protein
MRADVQVFITAAFHAVLSTSSVPGAGAVSEC